MSRETLPSLAYIARDGVQLWQRHEPDRGASIGVFTRGVKVEVRSRDEVSGMIEVAPLADVVGWVYQTDLTDEAPPPPY